MQKRKFKEINVNVKKKADVFTNMSEPLKEASVFDSGSEKYVGLSFTTKESGVYLSIKPKKAKKFAKAILRIAKRVQKG